MIANRAHSLHEDAWMHVQMLEYIQVTAALYKTLSNLDELQRF
jgi:hypothetical protein